MALPDDIAPPPETLAARGPWPARVLPGVALCVGVTAAAILLQMAEQRLFGRVWVEALVLAILLGAALRTAWAPGPRWRPGIAASAKLLLEIAVVLLGAGLSAGAILAGGGPALLLGIAVVVGVALVASYGIARAFKLPRRMAVLIACGNAICGNSAIAAVAPVIGAEARDVAAAIAFTAILGVVVVVGLPLLIPVLGLSATEFGILSGLTVYAVPQVLAATTPAGAVAVQIGTVVKLTRVLMLGPVVLVLSLITASRRAEAAEAARPGLGGKSRPALGQLVPWFILAFLAAAALRSLGLIPDRALGPILTLANLLTVIAMAALGLGVDVRELAQAGPRVTATVTLSLLTLGAISLVLIGLLGAA